MLCSKLDYQKGFSLILFSYKIRSGVSHAYIRYGRTGNGPCTHIYNLVGRQSDLAGLLGLDEDLFVANISHVYIRFGRASRMYIYVSVGQRTDLAGLLSRIYTIRSFVYTGNGPCRPPPTRRRFVCSRCLPPPAREISCENSYDL
jgi:hypothetical protein